MIELQEPEILYYGKLYWGWKGQVVISIFQGKIEMTLETMTKAEAEAKPAGQARDDPNKNPTLEQPK